MGLARSAGQDHPARRPLAAIADHQYVIAGTVKKLRDDIARRPRAVGAEDSLIFVQSFNLGAGLDGNFLQNLRQAGIRSATSRPSAIKTMVRPGLIIGGPIGGGGSPGVARKRLRSGRRSLGG